MKKSLFILSGLVISASALVIVSCSDSGDGNQKGAVNNADSNIAPSIADQVKHGEYLVTVIGCDDCHSPKTFGPKGPELDMVRRLSGRRSDLPLPKADTAALSSWMFFAHDLTASVGPWGASFSANLTSDPTGIGNWSFEQFKTALRKGKYKGMENGRDLLPPMPWQQYRNLTDEDLRDIFAFLKSTKPVANVVPAPIPLNELK